MSETGRSAKWFGREDVTGFIYRAFAKGTGFSDDDLTRPIIGIANTWSEMNHCNSHLRGIAEAVKRGVLQAGGLPLEFPTISLGEIFVKPTTMLYRNLMAIDTEEMIRAQPMDGVVLLCGCDKTTPAQLMGAASADVPAIMVTGGPMLNGQYRGQTLGACTDCRRYETELRAGTITRETYREMEDALCRSAGHCMVMGTASTMTSLAEAMGMTLPGCAAIPAPDSRRLRLAEASGRRIVGMVAEDLRPSRILTRAAFENAIRVLMALGGSTNAVIHLIAIAGRLNIALPLDLFDAFSRTTPFLANIRPSGEYQMEELFAAGGIPAVMKEISGLLHGDALTVTGRTVSENLEGAEVLDRRVIAPLAEPLHAEGGLAILRGNLAPRGAICKQTAAYCFATAGARSSSPVSPTSRRASTLLSWT
jgi:dihydroxy-acid dehydratase